MQRSLLPFILFILGYTLVLWARDMPLFEWEINEIVADIPPEFHFKTSPWVTRLGESVVGASYGNHYVFWQAYNPAGGIGACSPADLHPIVRRSWLAETLDRISIDFYQQGFPWLVHPIIVGPVLFLCTIYIWWFAIQYEHPTSGAIIGSVIVVMVFCGFLVNVWHPLYGRVVPGWTCSDSYNGTVTFSAQLSKVHYETLILFLAGSCGELGSLGIMLRQVRKAVIEGKVSSKSAVS